LKVTDFPLPRKSSVTIPEWPVTFVRSEAEGEQGVPLSRVCLHQSQRAARRWRSEKFTHELTMRFESLGFGGEFGHSHCSLVVDFECRRILGFHLAAIVDASGGDVGVSEPFLHLGDVGVMIERVCGGGGAQSMRSDLKA
jgi:hypothetical protein